MTDVSQTANTSAPVADGRRRLSRSTWADLAVAGLLVASAGLAAPHLQLVQALGKFSKSVPDGELGDFVVLGGLLLVASSAFAWRRWLELRWLLSNHEQAIAALTTAARTIENDNKLHRHAAQTDRLTGLPNRTSLLEHIDALLRSRMDPHPTQAVLYFDLDHFKYFNDTHGHAVGDALLHRIAERLLEVFPTGEAFVARLGGDEFAAVLHNLRQPADAERLAERLLQALRRPFRCGELSVVTGASLGIVVIGAEHQAAADVLRDADIAMYRAKHLGRSQFVAFTESLRDGFSRRARLAYDLREAVGNKELFLVYQPIVSLASGALSSVEALVRWDHPELGAISPAEFIPIAAESDLILELGDWVLREGCRQFVAWEQLLGAGAPGGMSINLSPRQFVQLDLAAKVEAALRAAGMDPRRLQLEITEDAFASDIENAIGIMHEIKSLHVKLAIDDFGTGCSSFSSLHRFPVDVLKVDRSLVVSIEHSPDTAALVHALAILVRNLGLNLVAEGVENSGQVIALQELGCQFGQGYYFAKPMPPSALEQYLIRQHPAGRSVEGALAFSHRWEGRLAVFEHLEQNPVT
jgi:diguanylate cyclase (GGDEF)-like protein